MSWYESQVRLWTSDGQVHRLYFGELPEPHSSTENRRRVEDATARRAIAQRRRDAQRFWADQAGLDLP